MSDFFSLYTHDFVRIACCVPRTRVADAQFNLAETLRLAAEGDKAGTALMVFPELGLSSYAIEDLLLQDALLDEVERVLKHGGACGKRLDFLMQELNREANTLGSKSAITEVSQASMDLKLLIEQMREQIQNLE